MTDATRGLSFEGGLVKVTSKVTPNRNQAIALTKKAEQTTQVENSWFISVGAFRDALLADPTYAPAYEGMARGFLLEGMVDRAEAALKSAVGLDAKFEQARFQLGIVRQMKADFAGAITDWRVLVALNPSYPDVYARMAIASYYIQDYKSAYAYLDEADKRKQRVPPQFRDLLKEAAPRP